jgi:hypothetical protein
MMLLFSFGVLACAPAFSLVGAQYSPKDLTIRNPYLASDADTLRAIRRALSLVERGTVLNNTITFDKSFNDDVLFS